MAEDLNGIGNIIEGALDRECQAFAFESEFNTARQPVKQLHGKNILQLANMPAAGAMDNVDFVRGLAEAVMPGSSAEKPSGC